MKKALCLAVALCCLLLPVLSPSALAGGNAAWKDQYAELLSGDSEAQAYSLDTFSGHDQPDLILRRGTGEDTRLQVWNAEGGKLKMLCEINPKGALPASAGPSYVGLLLVSSSEEKEEVSYAYLSEDTSGVLRTDIQYIRRQPSRPAAYTYLPEYAPGDLSGLDQPVMQDMANLYVLSQASLLDQPLTFSKPDDCPDFALTACDGSPLSLRELAASYDALVLNFFFINCPWCIQEFPFMKTALESYGDRVAVLCVSPYDQNADIAAFREELGLPFFMAEDPDGKISTYFRVQGYPTSFVLRPDGAISEEFSTVLSAGLFESHIDQAMNP